jgi:uncharacterized protein YcbK (DUF882 family)
MRLWWLCLSFVAALVLAPWSAALAKPKSKSKGKPKAVAAAPAEKRTISRGTMTLRSLNTREKIVGLKVMDVKTGKKGRVTEKLKPAAHRRISRLLRDHRNGQSKRIPERLLTQLYQIQQAFDAPMDIVSGYRHKARKTSRHYKGWAVDFRVEGANVKRVWEMCKRFKATGCGYYPKSGFVHMDVRDKNYAWIDVSGPGEKARYVRNETDAGKALAARAAADEVDRDTPLEGADEPEEGDETELPMDPPEAAVGR